MTRYNDLLQFKIDHALNTLDLSMIRRCQHLYRDEESLARVKDCVDQVHAIVRRNQRRAEIMFEDMLGSSDTEGFDNIVDFPFPHA